MRTFKALLLLAILAAAACFASELATTAAAVSVSHSTGR